MIMTIQDFVSLLQKNYPKFGSKVIYDQTAKGEDFCELVYPNENMPAYPLTVTVFDDGALISFGNLENITGGKHLTLDETMQALDDVTTDKIVFTLCYENREKQADGKISDRRVFVLTGDMDDQRKEYDKLIEQLRKPIGRFPRFLTPLKGVFVFLSFTGSVNFEIER